MTTRPCLIALMLAALWPAAGRAADPADWALPDASVAIVSRGLSTFADRLDALQARFGGSKALTADLAAARALAFDGLKPGARPMLDGADPARGLAIFATTAPRIRIAIGATDGRRLRASIAAFAKAHGFELTLSEDGFAGPMPMTCADIDGLMVCDSGPLPKAPPGPLPGMDPAAWLTARVDGTLLTELPAPWGLLVQHGQLDVFAETDRIAVRAGLKIRPDGMPLYGTVRDAMSPKTGASATDAIHPRTPVLLKFSFDAPALAALATQGDASPEAAQLEAFAAHWSGDMALSFLGGLSEPVVTMGLTDGATAKDLLRAIFDFYPAEDRPTITDDAVIFTVPGDDDSPGSRLTLAHRTVGRLVLFGIQPGDLARVEKERGLPPNLPPALAKRGTYGAFAAHIPATPGIGIPDFFEVDDEDVRTLTTLLSWLSIETRLMDGVACILVPGEDEITLELNWSRL